MNGSSGVKSSDHCGDHSGTCARMERAEQDIQTLFREIDGMKKWVIAGMSGLIMQALIFIGGVVLIVIQKHPV